MDLCYLCVSLASSFASPPSQGREPHTCVYLTVSQRVALPFFFFNAIIIIFFFKRRV